MRTDERIRVYWLIEAFWIICVILLFRSLERSTAAMIASAGFVLIPALILIFDRKQDGWGKPFLWVGNLQFLVLFALPVVILNFFPEMVPFELPLTGADFHRYSNLSYFLMILLTMFEQRRMKVRLAKTHQQS